MTDKSDTPIAMENRQADKERLFSPSVARNCQFITDILQTRLPDQARILEIGSGTGEHGLAVCKARPDVIWQPSDPDEKSRQSQHAWSHEISDRMQAPLNLDLTKEDWFSRVQPFNALVCMNVIHISPWAVAQGLMTGASVRLAQDGLIYLYGPYKEGASTAPSNDAFDQSLKARNPEWGVRELRDVSALFDSGGFDLEERIEMPSNNLSLVFRRRSA